MTTNAQSMLSTYRQGNIARAANDYAAAERDLEALWKSNEVRAGYISDEIKRLEGIASVYSGVSSGEQATKRMVEANKALDRAQKEHSERRIALAKAEEAYTDRWDNQALGTALTRLATELDDTLRAATAGYTGWEEKLTRQIQDMFADPEVTQYLGTGKLGRQQLQNEGVDFIELIYSKALAADADIKQDEIRRIVASSGIFAERGLNSWDLLPENLRNDKRYDRDAFVTGAVGPGGLFNADAALIAAAPDEQLTPDQLQMRRDSLARVDARIAKLQGQRQALTEPFTEQDVRRRQAEYYYGMPISKGPAEMMMEGLTDEEKIRFEASVRGGALAKSGKDLTKDKSSAATMGQQVYDMFRNGAIGTIPGAANIIGQWADGDQELRSRALDHLFALMTKEEDAMAYTPRVEPEEEVGMPFEEYQQDPGRFAGIDPQFLEEAGLPPEPGLGGPLAGEIQSAYGISPTLANTIVREATARGHHPYWWANLINAETGGSFDPTQPNQFGDAHGLIQFTDTTLGEMGLNRQSLLSMTAEEQVALAGQYFDMWDPDGSKIQSQYDLSIAVFQPAALGQPGYRLGKAASVRNQGWETADEHPAFVAQRARLEASAPPPQVVAPAPQPQVVTAVPQPTVAAAPYVPVQGHGRGAGMAAALQQPMAVSPAGAATGGGLLSFFTQPMQASGAAAGAPMTPTEAQVFDEILEPGTARITPIAGRIQR